MQPLHKRINRTVTQVSGKPHCQLRQFLETLTCSPLILLFLPSKTDEQDKITFDCRKKSLCDTNAACTADPRDENRYICVCNNGFNGDGSVC